MIVKIHHVRSSRRALAIAACAALLAAALQSGPARAVEPAPAATR